MSKTKKQLSMSLLSVVLCISMLLGTTYAWFTDSVTSGKNKIIAGNLDIEMYWSNDAVEWHDVEDPEYNAIFDYDNWEPGYTEVRYIKVRNAGNLAMKYAINMFANGEIGDLAEVINVYYIEDPLSVEVTRTAINTLAPAGVLTDLFSKFPVVEAELDKGGEHVFGIALKMQEEAGNEYQKKSIGDSFSVMLRATQLESEIDSFGSDYDTEAFFPEITLLETKAVSVSGNEVDAPVILGGKSADDAKAEIPAGVKVADGISELTLAISPMKNSGANIKSADEITRKSLDVHIEGVASDNTTPIIVTLDNYLRRNLNSTSVKLYHVENGQTNEMIHVATEAELTSHNTFTYEPHTGTVKMALASFSEILITADESDPWTGTIGKMPLEANGIYMINTAEELAAFAKAVNDGNDFSGKTVKLGKTIVLNDWKVDEEHDYTAKQLGDNNEPAFEQNGEKFHKFTPIGHGSNLSNETGANNDLKPFRGTFDGCGYAVSGLFNLWYDDPAEWSTQIGLFGCVENATIKNLTIRDSFIYTYGGMVGLVSSFAGGNSTFENITIQDNYATAYNNYLGGVVGVVFDHDSTNGNVTFKNCYVDNTNKFEALWGTYDAPIGGVVGGSYANSDVTFNNCTVFPEMSLYNDCCANYQWFAYRYSGMLIGYVRSGDRANYLADKVHCTNVTVKYGEWTDQYYCELVAAGKGSYNEPDEWKYVRIGKDQVIEEGKTCNVPGHDHANHPEEDHIATNITFNQLFGGGQGVYGETAHDGVEILENCGSIVKAFPNTDKYLYRVGNMNTVALGSLFKAKGGTVIRSGAIKITAKKISGVSSVDYTANTKDWTKGTLKFSGTGVVKLTLEYLTQEPIELNLEVVDAKNATTATSATANNVVLLNDVSGSSIDVSNGYTFYGNGFKINFSGTGSRNSSTGYAEGFVNITNGGILDNTQVVSKVFPKAYLYKSFGTEYITEPSNVVSSTDTTHYKYQWSAVAISGDGSTISNSYIYGARNNVYIGNGNVSLDNCVLECGALANMQIISNEQSTVSFKNLTTVQYLATDEFDVGNKMLGGAILIGSGDKDAMAAEQNPKIVVSGKFEQYNWVSSTEKDNITGSTQKTIINLALNQNKYSHDGYVNMGIVCLNGNTLEINGLPEGYSNQTVSNLGSSGQVYSLESAYGTVDTSYNDNNKYPYQPSTQGIASPSINYETSDERLTVLTAPTSISIIAKLDTGDMFDFKFSDLSLSCGGNDLDYAIKNASNMNVDKYQTVSLSNSGDTVYTLTASADAGYNPDGTHKSERRDISVKLTISISLKDTPAPEWISKPSGTPIYVGTLKGSDWSIAVPVLDGAKIKYWSTESNELKELDLSTISGVTKTTDNSLTITGSDYKLELTSGAIKSGKTNMWVMADGKLYVTISSASDYVSTGTTSRSTTVTYKFTANSKADAPISKSESFSANVPGSNDTTYKYSDLTSGKLTELTSGGGGECIIPGTLITMADGTQKPVEEIVAGDMLLTWDLTAGTYGAKPVVFNDHINQPEEWQDVVYVTFSDGTEIGIVTEHGFFDMNLGKYVYLDENAAQYIGHAFIKEDGSTVTLTNVEIRHEYTKYYSPTTFGDLCYYTNGMLSMPGGISGMFNIFDVDTDTMKYDEAKMQADIETYGLLDMDAFGGMITEDMFEAFNGKYLGVAVGKGNITWEYIAYLAERYAPLCK